MHELLEDAGEDGREGDLGKERRGGLLRRRGRARLEPGEINEILPRGRCHSDEEQDGDGHEQCAPEIT